MFGRFPARRLDNLPARVTALATINSNITYGKAVIFDVIVDSIDLKDDPISILDTSACDDDKANDFSFQDRRSAKIQFGYSNSHTSITQCYSFCKKTLDMKNTDLRFIGDIWPRWI